MGTCVENKRPRLRVMFFECGEFGGSVRSLANMLRGLNDLGCELGLVSHFRQTGPVNLGLFEDVHEKYFLNLPARVRPRPDVASRMIGIPYFTRFGLRYLYIALRALIRFRPKVAYLNNGPSEHLPAVIAAEILGIPLVCHLRSITRFSIADKFCLPRIRQFIVLTEWGHRFYHDQGIPLDKISQIYNPIDVADFDRTSEDYMYGSLIQNRNINVIQVGALTEHKQPDLAIESLKLARREVPNLRLILAGDGPMRNELEHKVRKDGLNDYVIFLGQCDQIPALLKRCHIGMFLSRSEGQGYCFLEYMTARLPVVTWAMPGIGDELIKDNQNGLVVPELSPEAIAQALVNLCRSPELRAKMGKAGREFVNNGQFNPKSHIQRIHSILTDIAQHS